MLPSCRLHLSLRGALVVVFTVAMGAMVMAITAAGGTATQEIAWPRQGGATVV